MTTSHVDAKSLRVDKSRPLRAVALLFSLLFFLSGCQGIKASVEVSAAGALDIEISIVGDKDSAETTGVSCESYGIFLRDYSGFKIFDYTKEKNDKETLCVIRREVDNGVDGKLLIDNDSTFILNIPMADFLSRIPSIDPSATYYFDIRMPGDIISATKGYKKLTGSHIVYEGKFADLDGDITIEAEKNEGTSVVVWVLGALVVLFIVVVLASKYLRKKPSSQGKGSGKSAGKRSKGDDKKSEDSSSSSTKRTDSVSVSTTDSSVALTPLPEKYSPKNIDGISESSYSEQIGLVDPIPQGAAADVVKRDVVLPAIPSESSSFSPIPGMPPRIPMPEDLIQEDADSAKNASETSAENDASAFFSSFLDSSDDEDIDEETDL